MHFLLLSLLFIKPMLQQPTDQESYTCPQLIADLVSAEQARMEDLLANTKVHAAFQQLAKQVADEGSLKKSEQLRIAVLLGEYTSASQILDELLSQATKGNAYDLIHYQVLLKAKLGAHQDAQTSQDPIAQELQRTFAGLGNREASKATYFTGWNLARGADYLDFLLKRFISQGPWQRGQVIYLLEQYQDYQTYAQVLPPALGLLAKDQERRYLINKQAMITTPDGARLSAIIARPKVEKGKLPTVLLFNIYCDEARNLNLAIEAASHGFVGVVADARGKRLSPDPIQPYETEGRDATSVIDWISRQPWSDGQVGMYGGSYLGFAQWAAAKYRHPALKTIVPIAAAIPGLGLPMENNIFLNANYAWAFHVTNNKTVDFSVYDQPQRWETLRDTLYEKGAPYRHIDQIDGTPNPWLQKWLEHPAYDAYWQSMVPYKQEYGNIGIPVLTITGYFDDGQVSALHYLTEHDAHHPNPNHYLVIGPYDHRSTQSTQREMLRGYRLDPVAHQDIPELSFQWLKHILKGAPKPPLLKDKINYQVMDGNRWEHAPSWSALQEKSVRFYLSHQAEKLPTGQQGYRLAAKRPQSQQSLTQSVDLTDRNQEHNDYYPWPIVKQELQIPNGLAFISEPFEQDHVLAGRFWGEMQVITNKRDFDLGLVLYELRADGSFFHLGYYLGRASFAADMSQRQCLTPGSMSNIPFERSRMTGKQLAKGSRLVLLVNVNVNRHGQVNYGTCKDVSDESMADADEPLKIQWLTGSTINLPLQPVSQKAGVSAPDKKESSR